MHLFKYTARAWEFKLHLWLVAFLSVVQLGQGVTLTVKLPGNVQAPSIVSVIDGDNLALSCHSDVEFASMVWSKPGNADFYREGSILNITNVRVQHGGDYVCAIFDKNGYEMKNTAVEVNILFGFGRVILTGPTSALQGDIFNMTCSADSNPDPTYYWSYNASGEPVVQRGPVLTETDFTSNKEFYCFAEALLVPTQGVPVPFSARSSKTVDWHATPDIYDLLNDYTVEEGDTLDILCRVTGNPEPSVYWSIFGLGSTAISTGERLYIPNIGTQSAGLYVVTAENMVTDAKGRSKTGRVSKNTRIRVTPKASTTSTTTPTTPEYQDSTDPVFDAEVCATKCNVTSYNYDSCPVTDNSCSNSIIAALVIGWIVVFILLLIGLFYYIRTRDVKQTPSWSLHHISKGSLRESGDGSESYVHARMANETTSARTGEINPPADEAVPVPAVERAPVQAPAGQLPNDGYITAYSGSGTPSACVEPYGTSVIPPCEARRDDESAGKAERETDHTYESV